MVICMASGAEAVIGQHSLGHPGELVLQQQTILAAASTLL